MRAKSKELKEAQGTYEPSKEKDNLELSIWNASRLPNASKEWPPRIQALWNRRCKELQVAGYLSEAFLVGLRMYCFAVMMAEEAHRNLIDENGTFKPDSKWISILEKAQKTISTYEAKFGFSPLDASKIPAIKKEVSNEESLLN